MAFRKIRNFLKNIPFIYFPYIYVKKVYRSIFNFKKNLDITAQCWDESSTAADPTYWWNLPVIRSEIQKRITGNGEVSWYTKEIRERKTPFGRILCFGDGKGMAAEAWQTKRDTKEIIYMNISPGEGKRFEKLMNEVGCYIPYKFVKADANKFDYSVLGKFDTIIAVGTFHHLYNFYEIFRQLNDQLNENGILYADEYVGPSKWKYDSKVIDIINNLLHNLPNELIARRKKVKQKDFSYLWINCGDPSEAIRSSKLDQELRNHFSLIEAVHFGGSLLLPFFMTSQMSPNRLKVNNWYDTETGKVEAKKLVELEEKLIQKGELKPDYMYYKLGKKTV